MEILDSNNDGQIDFKEFIIGMMLFNKAGEISADSTRKQKQLFIRRKSRFQIVAEEIFEDKDLEDGALIETSKNRNKMHKKLKSLAMSNDGLEMKSIMLQKEIKVARQTNLKLNDQLSELNDEIFKKDQQLKTLPTLIDKEKKLHEQIEKLKEELIITKKK